MNIIDVGKDFSPTLTNRDKRQRDGKHTAIEFRDKFLSDLNNKEAWKDNNPFIELDFSHVSKMGPSWANEAFAYFTKFVPPDKVRSKIVFKNISKVKSAIIDQELNAGYKTRSA